MGLISSFLKVDIFFNITRKELKILPIINFYKLFKLLIEVILYIAGCLVNNDVSKDHHITLAQFLLRDFVVEISHNKVSKLLDNLLLYY